MMSIEFNEHEQLLIDQFKAHTEQRIEDVNKFHNYFPEKILAKTEVLRDSYNPHHLKYMLSSKKRIEQMIERDINWREFDSYHELLTHSIVDQRKYEEIKLALSKKFGLELGNNRISKEKYIDFHVECGVQVKKMVCDFLGIEFDADSIRTINRNSRYAAMGMEQKKMMKIGEILRDKINSFLNSDYAEQNTQKVMREEFMKVLNENRGDINDKISVAIKEVVDTLKFDNDKISKILQEKVEEDYGDDIQDLLQEKLLKSLKESKLFNISQ